MVEVFNLDDIDFFVLDKVMVEIRFSARLLSRATILFDLAPLGIENRLPLRLSAFSSIIGLKEIGSFCFSQRHTIFDS